MPTFLELCQATRQESAISGSGPTTVVGQTGMLKKVVDWVNRAWREIQNGRDDWLWMKKTFTFDTIASVGNYTASGISLTDFAEWERDTFRIYLASDGLAGEIELAWIDYDSWRRAFNTGSQTDGQPIYFTVKPDKSIQLAPVPNGIYTVSGDYRQAAQSLSGNTDEPGMPARFHEMIMYKALMYYAVHDDAAEIYADAAKQYTLLHDMLVRDQVENNITFGAPLV